MPLTYLRAVRAITRVVATGVISPALRPPMAPEPPEAPVQPRRFQGNAPPSRPTPPAQAATPPALAMPTTAETLTELKGRLGKELYRIELDLQRGARIAGKPCDCLTRGKHLGGVEATAEELMSYEPNPIYGKVVDWLHRHEAEFQPAEIARREPDYYRGLVPQVRDFRKEVMGTEQLTALLTEEEKAKVVAMVQQEMG